MSFAIHQKTTADQLIVTVGGKIDEDADFIKIDWTSAPKVILDLDGVTVVNSIGIREWVKWVNGIPSSVKLTVKRVPKVLIDQLNVVAKFLPDFAVIESFYVPYFSEATDHEKMLLFEHGKHFKNGNVELPGEVRDDNDQLLEIDVIPEKYFRFIKRNAAKRS